MKKCIAMGTKVLLFALITIFAMPVLTDLSAFSAKADTIYYVSASTGLNLRSGAGTDYDVIRVLKKGTQLKKLGVKNGWWRVQGQNGNIGYCDSKWLSVYGSDNSSNSGGGTNISTGKLYYVNAVDRVNVRASASNSARLLGKLRGGTVVRVVEKRGSWAYIEVYNNRNRGYVLASLLKKYN